MKCHTGASWECRLIQQGSGCQVTDDLALSTAVLRDTMFGMCMAEWLNVIDNPYSRLHTWKVKVCWQVRPWEIITSQGDPHDSSRSCHDHLSTSSDSDTRRKYWWLKAVRSCHSTPEIQANPAVTASGRWKDWKVCIVDYPPAIPPIR